MSRGLVPVCQPSSTEDEVKDEVVGKLSSDLLISDGGVTKDDSSDHRLNLEDVLSITHVISDELLGQDASACVFHTCSMTQKRGPVQSPCSTYSIVTQLRL